jgi:hypothetical protein
VVGRLDLTSDSSVGAIICGNARSATAVFLGGAGYGGLSHDLLFAPACTIEIADNDRP